jgi:hypothetical protein
MSEAERQIYEWRLKIIESYQKEIEKAEEAKAISESRAEKANEHIINSGYMASGES